MVFIPESVEGIQYADVKPTEPSWWIRQGRRFGVTLLLELFDLTDSIGCSIVLYVVEAHVISLRSRGLTFLHQVFKSREGRRVDWDLIGISPTPAPEHLEALSQELYSSYSATIVAGNRVHDEAGDKAGATHMQAATVARADEELNRAGQRTLHCMPCRVRHGLTLAKVPEVIDVMGHEDVSVGHARNCSSTDQGTEI